MRHKLIFAVAFAALQAFGASSMDNCLFNGRWEISADRARTSAPAATVQFNASATTLSFDLEGHSRWRLDVDGSPKEYFVTGEERSVKVVKGLDGQRHRYRLIKVSETNPGYVILYKISTDKAGKFFDKPAASNRRIEFIGDSFTVGFGCEGGPGDSPDLEFEKTDASKSYAFLLADGLKADFQVNAASGRGIVRNYANIVPEWTLMDLYRYTVPGAAPAEPDAAVYDLATFHPQVVVIFAGINDFQGEPPYGDKAKFKKAYADLLDRLRSAHPGVKFLLVSTKIWPNDDLTPTVKAIYDAQVASGRSDLEFLAIQTENTALLGHPSVHSHQDMANKMRPIVARLGKWLSR
ncbi:GDSL-type esterase/lipase family protein [Fibrobacter sp.]|uniref:GDSL-type esterase/lipase family protein n=1 Tax=Fibrobacter sp. TaxID=35828 RepID=UPI001B241986|nr:GDSL-type esterase/lipase family protein [Fibrobacter sp.]MBO7059583.1 hypothetical protein [Fibrobacter sp.]MBR3669880.1 hypothetical protein [Fibrobacter sp.]